MYCFIVATCAACKAQIKCNPAYTPSIRVNGTKEPICVDCFKLWNEYHRPNDPLKLHPLAYEAIEESMIGDKSAQVDPLYTGHSERDQEKIENNQK